MGLDPVMNLVLLDVFLLVLTSKTFVKPDLCIRLMVVSDHMKVFEDWCCILAQSQILDICLSESGP